MELFAARHTTPGRVQRPQVLAHFGPPPADINKWLLDEDDSVHAILRTFQEPPMRTAILAPLADRRTCPHNRGTRRKMVSSG
ncbi:hypothetical protein AB7M42_007699 [Bradyrhizobium diazoefficiens]|jgi:hypothetical protein